MIWLSSPQWVKSINYTTCGSTCCWSYTCTISESLSVIRPSSQLRCFSLPSMSVLLRYGSKIWSLTNSIHTLNRSSTAPQRFLHRKLLRPHLSSIAFAPVIYNNTTYQQVASDKPTDNAGCYCAGVAGSLEQADWCRNVRGGYVKNVPRYHYLTVWCPQQMKVSRYIMSRW